MIQRIFKHWSSRASLLILIALGIGLAQGTKSGAISFTVDSTTDAVDINPGDGVCATSGGACTLRAAIQEANAFAGADTITLPSGTFTLTISGMEEDASATGDLDITSDLTIMGTGADTSIIDGGALDRVIHIPLITTTVTIVDVTIRNGDVGDMASGGGIYNQGTTNVISSTIINNQAGDMGIGGGISNGGAMTVTSSIVSDNDSYTYGGIQNYGTMAISNSVVSSNNAGDGGGGIGNDSMGILTVVGSVISNNDARGGVGGIANSGTLSLSNSTVSSNTTGLSGGGIYNSGTTYLVNVTIANNVADDDGGASGEGGGIRIITGTVSIKNSIIAGNLDRSPAGNMHPDCSGTLTSLGYNLIQDTTGCTIVGDITGNQTGVDPMLGPLQDNGGRTFTHALLPTSPAIDAADNTDCPATDQRGFPRPVDGNGDGVPVCDIGAFEALADSTFFVIKWANPDPVQAGDPLTYTIQVTNIDVVTLTATVTDTLPMHIMQGETSGGTTILPGGVITWTPISILPGSVWTDTIVVTSELGYAGSLTNVVEVTTEEGETGDYTLVSTVFSYYGVYLPVMLRNN